MKRLSRQKQLHRSNLAQKRWRKKVRRKGYGYAPDERYSILFPRTFSFTKDFRRTMAAIAKVKSLGHRPSVQQTIISVNFKDTTYASPAAMLVLNSEIDRIMSLYPRSVRFVPQKFSLWPKSIVTQLAERGFLDLLGLHMRPSWAESHEPEELTVVGTTACNRLAPSRVQHIRTQLENVAEVLEQGMTLYEAMIEATGNAVEHAYPEDHKYRYRPLKGGSWWATGVYVRSRAEVRVVVFDQGVGIPETLHRWRFAEQVRKILNVLPGGTLLINDHSRMISAALEVSRSSKASGLGRGQGLDDVVSPVELHGGGTVRILSGRGGVLYSKGKVLELLRLSRHIGGTLIEWTLPVFIESGTDPDGHES